MVKPILFCCFLVSSFSTFLSGQCLSGNCHDGTGSYLFSKKGVRYTGAFANGKPQGQGVAEYPGGKRYEGSWANGAFEGHGTITLPDGTLIDGEWQKGVFKGKNLAFPGASTTVIAGVQNQSGTSVSPVQPENRYSDPTRQRYPVTYPPRTSVSFPAVQNSDVGQSAKINNFSQNYLPVNAVKQKLPQVWALAVGIAAYEGTKKLRYTDDDAYRIFAFWKSVEGGSLDDFHAKVLVDESATRENILSTMRQLYAQAGPDDMIVLYFSGHGIEGAFLPFDYDGNVKISYTEVKEILENSAAKYKLCIADACHSGSLLASRSPSNERPSVDKYYQALMASKSGTALMTSSLSDEESLESIPLRQGVFSHFLLRGLKGEADQDRNGIVTIEELFDFVRKNVLKFAADNQRYQTPILQGNYDPKTPVAIIR